MVYEVLKNSFSENILATTSGSSSSFTLTVAHGDADVTHRLSNATQVNTDHLSLQAVAHKTSDIALQKFEIMRTGR